MIKPSVGRKIWFFPHVDDGHQPGDQPHSAEIVHVIDDRTVNLAIFSETGALYSKQAVQLLQEDDVPPATGHFAMWMPYQMGQAAKTEAAQTAAAPVDLASLHSRVNAIEEAVDGKFTELGDWLQVTFKDLEQRIAAVTPPPASPAPAPAENAADQSA